MTETLLSNEAAIRLGFFFGVLVVMAAWEAATPRRERTQTRALRWTYERWFLKRLPNGERLDIPMSNDLRVSFQLMGLDGGE